LVKGALNLNLLVTRDECKQYENKLSFTIKIYCQYLVFFTTCFGHLGHLQVMQEKKIHGNLTVTVSSVKRRNEISFLHRVQ
jgi:hypothetical protein